MGHAYIIGQYVPWHMNTWMAFLFFYFFSPLANTLRISSVLICKKSRFWLITGNRTSCCPMRFVIISWLNKSDSHNFVNRLYDYRQNWTPLSRYYRYIFLFFQARIHNDITITKKKEVKCKPRMLNHHKYTFIDTVYVTVNLHNIRQMLMMKYAPLNITSPPPNSYCKKPSVKIAPPDILGNYPQIQSKTRKTVNKPLKKGLWKI